MKKISVFFFFILFAAFTQAKEQQKLNVVVTIKPLHSLVQGVIGDTGNAILLMEGKHSPHGFALKPSQMRKLQQADLIFYLDDQLETFLPRVLKTLSVSTRAVPMSEAKHLQLLEQRSGGVWEKHHHGDLDDHHHREEHHVAEHHHEEEEEQNLDPHFWLHPQNAKVMVNFIAAKLIEKNPAHRQIYENNRSKLVMRLDSLDRKIGEKLKSVQSRSFVVFHDGFQYFENHYGLQGVGSITLEPDEFPSMSRIREIRHQVQEKNVVCVFREPQFSDKLVNTVIQGSGARSATLDPLGAELESGAELYFQLLESLTDNFVACLALSH